MTPKKFPRRADSPAAEPITLPQALAHLREVSDAGELDAYVTRLISVARAKYSPAVKVAEQPEKPAVKRTRKSSAAEQKED